MTSNISADALAGIAKRLRAHSLRMTTASGSGHPTTCLSMAEIAVRAVLPGHALEPARPGGLGERRAGPVQGPRRPDPVGGLCRGRRHSDRLPSRPAQDRQQPGGPSHSPHEMDQGRHRARWARACPWASAWPPPSGWAARPAASSWSWATANAPRDRSGRRPMPPPICAWPTSAPSSTSIGSASPIRPCTSTGWPPTPASSRPSAGRPWSSTATTSTRSRRPFSGRPHRGARWPSSPRPSRARASPSWRTATAGTAEPLKPEELDKSAGRARAPARRRRGRAHHPAARGHPARAGRALRLPAHRLRREDRHPDGLRQGPGGPGHGQRLRRGHRRRRQELHLCRQVLRGLPGPRLPVVHRRAEHDRDGHGLRGQGLHPLHGHLCRLLGPGPTTRSGWPPTPSPTSRSAARTSASASARTAPRRWDWKTSRCSGRCRTVSSSIPATRLRPKPVSRRPPAARAWSTSGRRGRRQPCSTAPPRRFRSAAPRLFDVRRRTRPRSSPPASPCTRL